LRERARGAARGTGRARGPAIDCVRGRSVAGRVRHASGRYVVPADPSLAGEELTLAQYAALCAELGVSPPEDALAIFIKYGIANDERRRRVDEFWRERLETRTQTYAEWRQLHRHFREHFLSLKRSP
jgi:hypothetical protein